MELPHSIAGLVEQVDVVRQLPSLVARSGPAAGGEAQAAFPPIEYDHTMLVDRISVQMPGAGTDCQAFVCLDEAHAENVIDGTEQGAFDISENATPYIVFEGRRLVVVWTGPDVFDGLVGQARIDFRDVWRRGQVSA